MSLPMPGVAEDLGGGFGEFDTIDAIFSASAYQTGNRAATKRGVTVKEKTLDDHLAS